MNDKNRVVEVLNIENGGVANTETVFGNGAVVRQPGNKFVYILRSDELDPGWPQRLESSINSLTGQRGVSDFEICIADYSTEPVPGELVSGVPSWVNFQHLPMELPFNWSVAVNRAYRYFCEGRCDYYAVTDIDVLFPDSFLESCLNTYIATGRNLCVTGVSQCTASAVLNYPDRLEGIEIHCAYPGPCMLISCELFEKIGGFDEALAEQGAAIQEFTNHAAAWDAYFVDRGISFVRWMNTDIASRDHPLSDEDGRRFDRELNAGTPRKWNRPVDPEFLKYFVPSHGKGFSMAVDRDNRFLVSDSRNHHRVNEAAAAIFSLCDGQRTVGEIVNCIQHQTGERQERLQVDVREGLVCLEKLGAIRFAKTSLD